MAVAASLRRFSGLAKTKFMFLPSMEKTGYGTLNKTSVVLIAIQGTCVFLFISSFNLNTILPWARSSHLLFMRTFLILLSFVTCFAEKLMSRKKQDHLCRLEFVLIFISHFVFCYAFICPRPYLLVFDGLPLLRKVHIHTNLIFSLINSSILAPYLFFLSRYICNIPIYTEVPGLFVYLKRQSASILSDSKKVFTASLQLGLAAAAIYFGIVHVILKALALVFRIDVVYTTLLDLSVHILAMSISNFIYFYAFAVLDHLIIFNGSFVSAKLARTDIFASSISSMSMEERHYWFHQVSLMYRELRLKNHTKMIKGVQECVEHELSELARLVRSMEGSKKQLDISLYVVVPQVNKNFIKRYRAYHIFEVIKKKINYEIEMFILSGRYRVLSGVVERMLNFVHCLKNNENLSIVSPTILKQIENLSSMVGDVEKMCEIDLEKRKFVELFAKLSQ